MAQTAAERKAAQRRNARELKAGTYKPISTNWAKPKAAKALGYTAAQWHDLDPQEKEVLRNNVRNAERRIDRFAGKPKQQRKRGAATADWETWEWNLYREAMGL
jgi:hypothetical protein